MVRRGQYLERPVVIPGEIGLEGLYHRGTKRPGLVIAPPHPRDGGAMELPVIAELAFAATRAGHPTLRFNHAGVGASPGVFDDRPEVAGRALEQALRHMLACIDGSPEDPVGLLGVGWGATLACHYALGPGIPIDPLILVSPEAVSLPPMGAFRGTLVIAVAQLDARSGREQLAALVRSVPDGRLTVVPEADASFLRGLVQLGKVVAETLSPPGLIDLR